MAHPADSTHADATANAILLISPQVQTASHLSADRISSRRRFGHDHRSVVWQFHARINAPIRWPLADFCSVFERFSATV